jgi:hypothetical protein
MLDVDECPAYRFGRTRVGPFRRRSAPLTAASTFLAGTLLSTACDPGDVALLAPDRRAGNAAALSIHVAIDTPYAALASALDWTAGVPAALVRVHRMQDPYDEANWITATADSMGLAAFPGLLSGLYEVSVRRVLSGDERTVTGDAVRLAGGGRRIYVSPGAEQAVTVSPTRRGTLVFSEFGLSTPLPWETDGSYPDAKYFEVYNDSDTTLYLDGKYWGVGWHFLRDYTAWPCEQSVEVRNDPQGLWTKWVFRFPGDGSDYPLRPGAAAVIAKAAIDHRDVHPNLYDLSHADFELGAWRAADNPDVPNMGEIGLRPILANTPMAGDPMYLSEPIDLASLPRYTDPHTGDAYVRIPGELILDASAGMYDFTSSSFEPRPSCLEAMHRSFERLPGPAGSSTDFYEGLSAQRRVLYVLPDGRNVLQDTDTSMEDFVKAPRTPGWVPDSLPG